MGDRCREVGVTRFGMCLIQKKKSIKCHLSSLYRPSSLPLSPKKNPPTVIMEDLFEGAVGIDLGTTYSYALPPLNLPLE